MVRIQTFESLLVNLSLLDTTINSCRECYQLTADMDEKRVAYHRLCQLRRHRGKMCSVIRNKVARLIWEARTLKINAHGMFDSWMSFELIDLHDKNMAKADAARRAMRPEPQNK